MNRTACLFVATLTAALMVAGCATRSIALDPAPAGAGEPLGQADDSLGLLVAEISHTAHMASDEEVEAEVMEMFGEEDINSLEAAGPSWDIPITINESVKHWLDHFQGIGRENFAIYLARAGRYESMMRAMFRDAGLPEDLIYLSLIESGFSPRAYSRARAVGLWQFISSTGRLYGLSVSYWVDERRDPILATKAAAKHLRDLHEEFGSWYLVAAAYNGGANRVRRSIVHSGSEDFWTLAQRRYLRRETRNYVPKLIAAALIAKQPDHYGFVEIQLHDPFAYEIVDVPDATSLDVIAEAAGTTVEAVSELNPQILRGVTPPGQRYAVRVPPGTGQRFAVNYAQVAPGKRVTWVQHVVRRGETLSGIARNYGVSVSAVRAANSGADPRRLQIGQRLVIPRAGKLPTYAAVQTARPSTPSSVRVIRPEGPYITYRVQGGDSLWAIARKYDVTARNLMLWNGLRTSRIYPGDEVRIYVGPN